MSGTILPFKGRKPQEPVFIENNDAKVMLVLAADLMSDVPGGAGNIEKDMELFNSIQSYLSNLDLPDQMTKQDLSNTLDKMIDEFDSFADLDYTYSIIEDDFAILGKDTKGKLLDIYGVQCEEPPSIPEIEGGTSDGPEF